MRSFLALLLLVLALPAEAQNLLVLKNGEHLNGDVQWMPSATNARYALHNGSRVEFRDIALASTEEGEFGVILHPSFNTPLLMRQVTAGRRISLYSEANVGYDSGIQCLRKDGGPLLHLNRETLYDALSDNPESLRHLRRRGTYQAIGYTSLAVGAALALTGGALQLGGYESASPLTSPIVIALAGVGFATGVNVIVPVLSDRSDRKAIAAYNR